MNPRAELLVWKRQQLLAESAAQRADLAQQLRPLAYRLESVGTGLRIVGRIRRHPGWIAALALGLVILTPRRLSTLLRLGATGLRTWRTISPTLQMLMDRRS